MKVRSLEDYVYSKHGVFGKNEVFECSEAEVARLESLHFKMEVLEGEEKKGGKGDKGGAVPPPPETTVSKGEGGEVPLTPDGEGKVANENLLTFNEVASKLGINVKALATLIKGSGVEKVDGKYDVSLIEKALEASKEESKTA